MRRFGLRAIYAKPNLSAARKENKKYPYLLKNKIIRYPNQVWASDITYLKLPGGNMYLVVLLDILLNVYCRSKEYGVESNEYGVWSMEYGVRRKLETKFVRILNHTV